MECKHKCILYNFKGKKRKKTKSVNSQKAINKRQMSFNEKIYIIITYIEKMKKFAKSRNHFFFFDIYKNMSVALRLFVNIRIYIVLICRDFEFIVMENKIMIFRVLRL